MGALAIGVLCLLLAGALASWAVAAVYGIRAVAASDPSHVSALRRLAVVAWPFGANRISGRSAENAAVVNKAVIVFMVCLTLAVVTISLSTNLNRIAS